MRDSDHQAERCVVLHTGMKSVAMDENKSRIVDVLDRTTVGVVEDDIISNRQSRHCGVAISAACAQCGKIYYQ